VPYSRALVRGKKTRFGKYIYRLFDTENEYVHRSKQVVKSNDSTVADILWDGSYIVIPPSIYSECRETGNREYYEWEHEGILDMGLNNLPILTDDNIADKIKMASDGMTLADMSKNLPVGSIDLSSNTSMIADGHRQSLLK